MSDAKDEVATAVIRRWILLLLEEKDGEALAGAKKGDAGGGFGPHSIFGGLAISRTRNTRSQRTLP